MKVNTADVDYNNHDDNSYMLQQKLGVSGTSLVSPGWLVLGILVRTCGVQT